MGDVNQGLSAAMDTLTLDKLSNPESRTLLDTIDSLRELQVGEIVNLPQIIVVGDQSSGKSSVLEAISRVRFPAKGDVCTRFATELVLRRAPESKVNVKINPAGSTTAQRFQRDSFHPDDLPSIIGEAMSHVGIHLGGNKAFSKDILHIEIVGPDVTPVTLVDLPGFFHSETAEQSPEDKEIVDQLATSYMKQSKSIILAVVAANQQLANQIVLTEAKKYDPESERTIGVITKPDLPRPGSSDERKFLQLARNQESKNKLQQGWHVLRNRSEGGEASTSAERDAEEERFFSQGAWSSLPPNNRGIASLRNRLSKVLLGHIRKTLPGLIQEIESQLEIRQQGLERLGKARTNSEELRFYLHGIAEEFKRLAQNAVDGRYNDSFFGDLYDDDDTRKLRALLRSLNRGFHTVLLKKGARREIEWDDQDDQDDPDETDSEPPYLRPFLALYDDFPSPELVSESDLHFELEQLAAANQGREFPGLPNGELAFDLFKDQAKPWAGIARFHLDKTIEFAKSFVEKLLSHIIGADTQTTNSILINCVDPYFQTKREGLKIKLEELLRPYVAAYGPALDVEFHAALSGTTGEREAARIADLIEERYPFIFEDKPNQGLSREDLESMISNAEDAESNAFGTTRIIDMMITHYNVRASHHS